MTVYGTFAMTVYGIGTSDRKSKLVIYTNSIL